MATYFKIRQGDWTYKIEVILTPWAIPVSDLISMDLQLQNIRLQLELAACQTAYKATTTPPDAEAVRQGDA